MNYRGTGLGFEEATMSKVEMPRLAKSTPSAWKSPLTVDDGGPRRVTYKSLCLGSPRFHSPQLTE